MKCDVWTRPKCQKKNIRELKHQTFLEPRTPTGSIFAAWQPLRMSMRSRTVNTRVLTLKREVQILCSSKSFRHTKVEIPRLKSCFPRKRETKLNANLWKRFSTELFRRRSWWFHVVLPNDFYLSRKLRPRSSSARPAILFVNQERLVLKFPIVLVGQTQYGMVYQLNHVVLYCWTHSSHWRKLSTGLEKG